MGGEPPVGALAFNTLRAERDWPDALVKRLQLVAQVFTNALARKRHELSLQESEERLAWRRTPPRRGSGPWTSAPACFWVTERARAIFGYAPDELISMERFEASVHPDDWDLVRGAVERSARAGEPVQVEYRIVAPGDGRVRWIASRGRPHLTSTGEPDRLMGVSIDVTERRRGDDAHRTSEARLAAGADLAGLAFYEVDFGEGGMYVDDRFRDICGVPADREQGLQALAVLDGAPASRRPRRACWTCASSCTTGGWNGSPSSIASCIRPEGEKWIQHLAGVAARDATGRAVQSPSASSATSPSASGPRTSCAT